MKNFINTLLLTLLILSGYAQNPKFQYSGRLTPSITYTKLNEANFVYEIMPEFNRYFVLPFNENAQFEKQVISVYPQASFYPQENYKYLFNYVSVEISAICDGKVISSVSKSDTLTSEQKNVINSAEPGTDINIKIRFRYKNENKSIRSAVDNITEGEYTVTVIPQKEAEYPGGFKQFTEYYLENVFNNIPQQNSAEKIQQVVLKFTIDEEGQIADARISKTSTDPVIDAIILEATSKMPKWMPAKNSKGLKIRQQFSIPFGGGGC